MINFQKRYFIETLEKNETNSGHKHMPHLYSSRFQKHFYDESALSQNLSTNVMNTVHIIPLNIKTFSYNTKKVLIFSREDRHLTLITHT